jgi:hypothetical protein
MGSGPIDNQPFTIAPNYVVLTPLVFDVGSLLPISVFVVFIDPLHHET